MRLRRVAAAAMSVVLVGSSLWMPGVSAEDSPPAASSPSPSTTDGVAATEAEAVVEAQRSGKPVQVSSLMSAQNDVRALPGGQLEQSIHVAPQRVFEDGKYVEIDTTLTLRPRRIERPSTVAALVTRDGHHAFTGRSSFRHPTNWRVQSALDSIPINRRSEFHGACAEISCLSQAFDNGVDVKGGILVAVRVRGLSSTRHKEVYTACKSCRAVADILGVDAW